MPDGAFKDEPAFDREPLDEVANRENGRGHVRPPPGRSAKWQAALWIASPRIGGVAVVQIGWPCGQRGWKAQPPGKTPSAGGVPSIENRRSRSTAMSGIDAIR